MKYTIKRERPRRRPDTTRLSDLRGKETGTYAMPSGDSAAAAVFCYLVAFEMGLPQVPVIGPMQGSPKINPRFICLNQEAQSTLAEIDVPFMAK